MGNEADNKQTPDDYALSVRTRMQMIGELISKGTLLVEESKDYRWQNRMAEFKDFGASIPVDRIRKLIATVDGMLREAELGDPNAKRLLKTPRVTVADALEGKEKALPIRDHEDYNPLISALVVLKNDIHLLTEARRGNYTLTALSRKLGQSSVPDHK